MAEKKQKDIRAFEVGQSYFFRLVTHYDVGRVIAIDGDLLVLEQASWIADTGRFATFLQTGQANEVEPFGGRCIINVNALIDAAPWPHDLPKTQK